MLPPGVSQREFAAAIAEFRAVLGRDWVFTSEQDLTLYRDAYSPFRGLGDQERRASAAVAPASVEQVQQVVRIANRHRIPLYTISTGRNLGYGGAAPGMSGCVVVDLKRMNKVVEVDVDQAYVIVEPGVSFIELSRYFVEHNLPLMVASAENGAGGPIGNALERGTSGLLGDNFARAAGMEVVLPNGELLRTGAGAVSNAKLWPLYRYGFGPTIDGIFTQSNFGIVTKMVFWLERQPEMVQYFTVTSQRSDDLGQMVETIQRMRHSGLVYRSGGMSPLRSANNTTTGNTSRNIKAVEDLLNTPGQGSASAWDALSRETNIAVSGATGGIRGPAKVVQGIIDHARDEFAKIKGSTFNLGTTYRFPIDPKTVPVEDRYSLGYPNLFGFQRLANQGVNRGHYYFSPNIMARVDDMFAVNRVIRKALADFGDMDMLKRWGWQAGSGFFPKTFTILLDFVVTDDMAFNARRLQLFEKLVHVAAENGWAEYRAPAGLQDSVAAVYNYNNSVLRRFNETIKDAIDPNGILSPGRGGIWPKRFRKAKA